MPGSPTPAPSCVGIQSDSSLAQARDQIHAMKRVRDIERSGRRACCNGHDDACSLNERTCGTERNGRHTSMQVNFSSRRVGMLERPSAASRNLAR